MVYGYGYRRRLPIARDYKKDLPKLEKIAELNLKDLQKIRKFIAEYPDKVARVRAENHDIDEMNVKREERNEARRNRCAAEEKRIAAEWEKTRLASIRTKRSDIWQKLLECKVGTVGGWFNEVIETRIDCERLYLKKYPGEELLRRYREVDDEFDRVRSAMPTVHRSPDEPILARKKLPADYTVLTISGAKVRVYNNSFSIPEIDQVIARRLEENNKQDDRLREMQARAAVKEKEVRSLAKQFRQELHGQLRLVKCCPYCGGVLSESNAHQDHIYPVAKGGLSARRNLVFVCGACNLRKRDKTLRSFIQGSNLDPSKVHARLELLKKDF